MKKGKKITRAMLRRRNRRFYTIYIAVVAVVLLGFFIGSQYLLGELREFEDTRNIHTANRFFQLFENGDYETLYNYETGYRDADASQYAALAREMTQGAQMELVARAETGAYYVTLDGKKFAELNLSLIPGQTSPKGYSLWDLESVHILSLPMSTFRVRAREDYTVFCDGAPLTDDQKVESGLRLPIADHLPSSVHAPTECVYEVSRLSGEPVFTCTDHKGRPVTLTDENGVWTAGMNFDEIDDETRSYVGKTAKCLALYTSDDKDFLEMSKYLLKDSDAYKSIRALETGWFTLHTSYRFENVSVTNAAYYADGDILACDVNLTFIIVARKNNQDKSYPMAYTFYYQKSGGKWLLYDMMSIDIEP